MKSENLIPRKILFGNPEKAALIISYDGKFLSYLAPLNNVLNVYVMENKPAAQPRAVTTDTHRGIQVYFWARDNNHIIYMRDNNGDENYQLYITEVSTGKERTLTNFNNSRVGISKVSRLFPNEIIISVNERRKDFFDLYKLNIISGTTEKIYQNDQFVSIIIDEKYDLRFAIETNNDGSSTIYKFKDGKILDQPFINIPSDDIYTTGISGFDKDGENIYLIDSRNRNTSALFLMNIESGKQSLIYAHDKVDISGLSTHPTEKYIQAVQYTYLKDEIVIIDKEFGRDYNYVKNYCQGELTITSRSDDDQTWLAADVRDDGPVSYYKFDRKTKNLDFLFHNRPELNEWSLAKMHPVIIKSRDNLELPSYLTMPKEAEFDSKSLTTKKPVPLILWVHGGPTARDEFGYNATHQWLANRGIAVLSVNYRGSTGFGKNFTNAGNGEWSRKAHNDLIDATNWAIKHKLTTKDQLVIGGGSYGGYAALVGLTFTPDLFCCAIDIVGMSNLVTLLETIPPYWKPALKSLEKKAGGSIDTKEGKEELMKRSPISRVDKICKPLLIGQGANDPRVKQSESDQIVQEMKRNSIPVTYILYPEEGHGFTKPENRMSFFAIAEKFLHQVLGTRYENIEPNDFKNAKFIIKEYGELDIKHHPEL
jgi:dipeptidyl aminopeptidase/acylaminoacyl peptidase